MEQIRVSSVNVKSRLINYCNSINDCFNASLAVAYKSTEQDNFQLPDKYMLDFGPGKYHQQFSRVSKIPLP